jgi:hypothetical protein
LLAGIGFDMSVLLDCCFCFVKFLGHPNYNCYNIKIFSGKREEIAAAQEHFNKRTIVIERGVLKPDIRVAPFDFIYHRFQENLWSSMLNAAGKIYPRLLWEFNKNLVITSISE